MVVVGLTPAVIITGCGGGGGHTAVLAPGPTANRGVLTLKVTFPKHKSGSATSKQSRHTPVGRSQGGGGGAYDGSIPQGTLSVKVVLLNPTTGAALAVPQVIQAPPDGSSSVSTPQTAAFTNLPVGPVRVQVQAFPTFAADTAQGPGEANPIAVGMADTQIVANQTVAAQVLLQLTIDHVTLMPTSVTLPPLNAATLTAQAFDKNNAPLIYPFTFATSNSYVVTTYQIDNQTVEVSSDYNTGTAVITATEVNSQLAATSNVTVAFNGG